MKKNRLYKRLLETDPSLASYRGTDTDSAVLFPGKERADDPCGRNPDPGTCRDAFVGVYGKKPVLQGTEDKLENLEEKYLIREMIKAPDFLEGRILYDTADQMGKAMGDQIFAQQRKNNAFKPVCGSLDP